MRWATVVDALEPDLSLTDNPRGEVENYLKQFLERQNHARSVVHKADAVATVDWLKRRGATLGKSGHTNQVNMSTTTASTQRGNQCGIDLGP